MKALRKLLAAVAISWAMMAHLSAAVNTNLFDDFLGTSLDTSKWTTPVPTYPPVGVSGGNLAICAGCVGSAVNVTSLQTFQPAPVSATEEFTLDVKVVNTRVTWAGFGGFGSPDTLQFRRDQTANWYISEGANLVDTGVTVADDSASNLRIVWSTNSATFQIDANLDSIYEYSATFPHTIVGALPVLLRDQPTVSLSLYDSVLVTSVPEPCAAMLAGVGVLLVVRRRCSKRWTR